MKDRRTRTEAKEREIHRGQENDSFGSSELLLRARNLSVAGHRSHLDRQGFSEDALGVGRDHPSQRREGGGLRGRRWRKRRVFTAVHARCPTRSRVPHAVMSVASRRGRAECEDGSPVSPHFPTLDASAER